MDFDGWTLSPPMTAMRRLVPSFTPLVLLFVDSGLDEDRMFESKLVEKEPHNKGCMSRGLAVARALQLLELKPKGKGHADRVGDGGGVPGDGSLPILDKAFAAPDGEAESEDED